MDNVLEGRFIAGLAAFKRARDAHWAGSLLFGENWEDQREYEPDIYLEILEEDLDLAERALRSYALFRGEIAKFPYLDYYRALARTRGCEGGWDYAATFALPPEAKRRRVSSLLTS